MALQLNPDSSDVPAQEKPETQIPLRQAVAQNHAEPLPPVVLMVPNAVGTDRAVVARIEPTAESKSKPTAPEPALEPIVAIEPGPTRRSPREFAQAAVTATLQRVESIPWKKIGQWMDRPAVGYSFAASLLLAITIAIIASPRNPAPVENPTAAPLADAEPTSQDASPETSQIAEVPRMQVIEQPAPPVMEKPTIIEPAPSSSDSIVKLPPVHGSGGASHVFPWRRDAASGISTVPPIPDAVHESRVPQATTQREGAVPFPSTRSAVHSHNSNTQRPNVARLEGHIETPNLAR